MPVLTLTVILTGLIYMIMILWFYRGWRKLKVYQGKNEELKTPVSLIIPVRNEESNIPRLIAGIKKQNYPARLLEVIFVDDHSDDRSFQLIKEHIEGKENYYLVPGDGKGKKPALQTGYKKATGNLIITTDADCDHPPGWISAFAGYYEKYHPKLIAGPVFLEKGSNFLQCFQQFEVLGLTASTAGSFGAGHPIMCNGANLAFARDILGKGEDIMNRDFASGDDMFLLQNIKQKYPGQSHYIKSGDAVVTTEGQPDLRSFIKQRARWASKSSGYRDIDTIVSGIVVLLINFLLLWTLGATFFEPSVLSLFVFLYILKTVSDLLLISSFSSFIGLKTRLWIFPIMQLVYPFYIVFTYLGALNRKYEWKGRYHNK